MLGNLNKGCYCLLLLLFSCFISCKKDTKPEEAVQKPIPYYDEIPTVLVENYLNRMFIDLVGREPLDSEMTYYVNYLRENDLSFESREAIARQLQTDTTPREGEVSYKHAYYHWFYERAKADLLESATLGDIEKEIGDIKRARYIDSLNGDSSKFPIYDAAISRLENVIDAEANYRDGKIGFRDMFGFLVNNSVYDFINMNTFNFVNAIFDNLFFRMPTKYEFENSFEIIENNKSAIILGKSASNKDDYVDVIINSREFYNGMVMRGYLKLLVREPTSAETASAMAQLFFDNDYQKFQRKILISDEYAQFKPSYR